MVFYKSTGDRQNTTLLRTLQIGLALYSIGYIFVLYTGYKNLLAAQGPFLATLAGLGLAIAAWVFAKFVGSADRGIRTQWPAFALVLLLSAAGVFNFLMLTLEGKRIFVEAVDASQDAFSNLKASARANVRNNDLATAKAVVDGKAHAFVTEVRNRMNCGYGPAARDLQNQLLTVLPELKLPTAGNRANTDAECEARANAYQQAIDDAWGSSPKGRQLAQVESDLSEIIAKSDQQKAKMDGYRDAANTDGISYIIGDGRTQMSNVDQIYKELVEKLRGYAPNPGLPTHLQLDTLSKLGDWNQIFSIFLARLDKISTYFYLALAFGADYLLVWMFMRLRTYRSRQPPEPTIKPSEVEHL